MTCFSADATCANTRSATSCNNAVVLQKILLQSRFIFEVRLQYQYQIFFELTRLLVAATVSLILFPCCVSPLWPLRFCPLPHPKEGDQSLWNCFSDWGCPQPVLPRPSPSRRQHFIETFPGNVASWSPRLGPNNGRAKQNKSCKAHTCVQLSPCIHVHPSNCHLRNTRKVKPL